MVKYNNKPNGYKVFIEELVSIVYSLVYGHPPPRVRTYRRLQVYVTEEFIVQVLWLVLGKRLYSVENLWSSS